MLSPMGQDVKRVLHYCQKIKSMFYRCEVEHFMDLCFVVVVRLFKIMLSNLNFSIIF